MQPWKQIGKYGTVGLELVAFMGFGYWVGRWGDGKLGTKYLALLGLLFGIVAGFRNLIRAANLMQREADREAREQAPLEVAMLERRAARLRGEELDEDEVKPAPRVEAVTPSEPVESEPTGEAERESTEDIKKNLAINARGSRNGDRPS